MVSANIAIIGLGPRGLNVLERISALLSEGVPSIPMTIHLIDPAIPGQGVHAWSQPQHLLVNTVAGQITMYSDETVEDSGPAVAGPSFLEWAHEKGYRCVDGKFIISEAGRDIGENDYLPRSLLGEYLTAVFDRLVKSFPTNVVIHNHRRPAVNITEHDNGTLSVQLEGDYVVTADFCFLALGHCEGERDEFDHVLEEQALKGQSINSQLRYFRSPYPISSLSAISNHSTTPGTAAGAGTRCRAPCAPVAMWFPRQPAPASASNIICCPRNCYLFELFAFPKQDRARTLTRESARSLDAIVPELSLLAASGLLIFTVERLDLLAHVPALLMPFFSDIHGVLLVLIVLLPLVTVAGLHPLILIGVFFPLMQPAAFEDTHLRYLAWTSMFVMANLMSPVSISSIVAATSIGANTRQTSYLANWKFCIGLMLFTYIYLSCLAR